MNRRYSPKQMFFLHSLILALLHSWTLGHNPKKDLDSLEIDPDDARKIIQDLVTRGLVKSHVDNFSRTFPIGSIINYPLNLRESSPFTTKGQETYADIFKTQTLEDLIKKWQKWQEK